MQILLPKEQKQWDEPIEVEYRFGLKHAARTDVDNLIKPLQDILVRTGIILNDRLIMRMTAEKFKSGIDTVEVTIRPYGNS